MKQIILIVYFAIACSAPSFANLRLLTSSFTHPDLAKWAAENPVVLENFTKQDFVGLPVKNDNDYDEAKTEANKIANAHGFLVFSFDAYTLAPESDSLFKVKIDAKIKSTLGYNYQGAYVAFLMLRESLDDNSFVFQSVINWANYGRSNALTAPQKNSIAINTETWAKKIFDGDFSQRAWAASSGTKKLKAFLDEDPEAYFLINLKKFKQNETVFVPRTARLEIQAFRSDGTPMNIQNWSSIKDIKPLLDNSNKSKANYQILGASKDEMGDELLASGVNDYRCKVRIVAIEVSIHREVYDGNLASNKQDYSALDNNKVIQYPSFYANSYFNSYKGKGYKYYNNDGVGIPYQFINKNKSVTIKIKSQPELTKSKVYCTLGNNNLFNVLNVDNKSIICCSNNYNFAMDTSSLFIRVGNADGFLLSLAILQSNRPEHSKDINRKIKFYLLESTSIKMAKEQEFLNNYQPLIKEMSRRYYQNIGFTFSPVIPKHVEKISNINFDANGNGIWEVNVNSQSWTEEAVSIVNSLSDLEDLNVILYDNAYLYDAKKSKYEPVEAAALQGNNVIIGSFKHLFGDYFNEKDRNYFMKAFAHEIGHVYGLKHPFEFNIALHKHVDDNTYLCPSCKSCSTCGLRFILGLTDPLNIMDYAPVENLLFRKYQWDILYNNLEITKQ